MNTVTCKNCGINFSGKYCSNCRQPAETHQITWHEISHQLIHAVFHADAGFFYTIKELFLKPGITIRDYIQGKRAYHFNPILFLLLTGGAASLLFSYLHISPPIKEIDLDKIEKHSGGLAHKYFAAIGLIFIFLLTITDYLFNYKPKHIIPELIISNTFQTGQTLVYTIAFLPLLILQNYISHKFNINIEMRLFIKLIVLSFLIITRIQFHEAKGNPQLIFKIILQIALVFVIYNYAISRIIIYWQG